MEPINFTFNGTQLEVQGIPNAHKVVKLPSEMAKYLVDLSLHQTDLVISKESLSFIERNQLILDSNIIESLWRSSILHFIKCFTDQVSIKKNGRKVAPEYSRTKLDKSIIFKNELALSAFDYIMTLRNKHIVHDENPYLKSTPAFIINNGSYKYKVEKIFCTITRSDTVEGNFSNLLLLVNETLDYVNNEFTNEGTRVTSELEGFSFNKLLGFGEVNLDIASLEDMKISRKLD